MQTIDRQTRSKTPRVTCTVCFKPAIKYYIKKKLKSGETVRDLVYEHRDEEPVKEFYHRGKRMFRYRRCNQGRVKDSSSLFKEDDTGKDYKKMYWDLIDNLRKIVEDADGI
jgi:hypothetical protein